ncbi:MAG: DUF4156 domain-containing protein [Helicobacteraceae bacterium]|nr:DUF4156 domain-containing protein [Helicobacteraceae bacterium]
MITRLILTLIAILFIACSGTINILNSEARFVQIVTTEPAPNCEYLGEVYGSQKNSGMFSEAQLNEGAINDTKNKAKAIGGDTIFFLTNQNKLTIRSNGSNIVLDDSLKSTQEINITALVYKCK